MKNITVMGAGNIGSAIADMLHGSTTARIEKLGLTRLSTHSLLGEYKPAWLLALLRRLMTANLVELRAVAPHRRAAAR